jgi:hypothetical protein
LLQLVYVEPTKKLYGVDRFIKLKLTEKRDEQIRNSDDYSLNLSSLKEAVNSPAVSAVNFYTEKKELRDELSGAAKFAEMSL